MDDQEKIMDLLCENRNLKTALIRNKREMESMVLILSKRIENAENFLRPDEEK